MSAQTFRADPKLFFATFVFLIVLATLAATRYLIDGYVLYFVAYAAVLIFLTIPGKRLYRLVAHLSREQDDETQKNTRQTSDHQALVRQKAVFLGKSATVAELNCYRNLILKTCGARIGSQHAINSAFDHLVQIRELDVSAYPTWETALATIDGQNGEPTSRIRKLYYGKYPTMNGWIAQLDEGVLH